VSAVENDYMDGLHQLIGQMLENRAVLESLSHDLPALAHLAAY